MASRLTLRCHYTWSMTRLSLVLDRKLAIQVADDYLAKPTTRFKKDEGSSPNGIVLRH